MVLMAKKGINIEVGLYILAFLLALGLRFLNLGATPLSNDEAGWALQALEIAHGSAAEIGPQPGYVALTGLLFFVFGDSNVMARMIPAIMGSMLVWLPFLFRPLSGESPRLRLAGIIMAFGLAVDPGLVAMARIAGGPIPALGFSLLALGLVFRREYILAGVLAGLALLSGPALIQGGLALALAWGAGKLLNNAGKLQPLSAKWSGGEPNQPSSKVAWMGFVSALAVFLLVGTLFGQVPQGLSAFARTLPEYLRGWLTSSGIPLLRLPVALLVYETLILVLGITGAGRGWFTRDETDPARALSQRLSIWGLTSLLMALIYPARQVNDLVWMLVPLWGLAALEISRYTAVGERLSIKLVASGQAILVIIVLGLSWLNLTSITRNPAEARIFWLVIGGLILMGLIATLLIALGWSVVAARLGLVWGVSTVLVFWMISVLWGVSQLRFNSVKELWFNIPSVAQAGEIMDTLTDFSAWNTGLQNELDMVVIMDSPALRWLLRDFKAARFDTALAPTDTPTIVITATGQELPSLALSYRGQDLYWDIYPAWEGAVPPNWISWLTFREAPLAKSQIILWARSDAFPGGTLVTPDEAPVPVGADGAAPEIDTAP